LALKKMVANGISTDFKEMGKTLAHSVEKKQAL